MQTYFKWMQAEFGFSADKVKPYAFNPQPFLVDKHSAMQGYVTSEPYAVEGRRLQGEDLSARPTMASTPTRP